MKKNKMLRDTSAVMQLAKSRRPKSKLVLLSTMLVPLPSGLSFATEDKVSSMQMNSQHVLPNLKDLQSSLGKDSFKQNKKQHYKQFKNVAIQHFPKQILFLIQNCKSAFLFIIIKVN